MGIELNTFTAWDAPGRTSQRRAIGQMGAESTVIYGGNCTGKTTLALMLAVCSALGSDEPVVRELLTRNGSGPPPWMQPCPSKVTLAALTCDDSIVVEGAGRVRA